MWEKRPTECRRVRDTNCGRIDPLYPMTPNYHLPTPGLILLKVPVRYLRLYWYSVYRGRHFYCCRQARCQLWQCWLWPLVETTVKLPLVRGTTTVKLRTSPEWAILISPSRATTGRVAKLRRLGLRPPMRGRVGQTSYGPARASLGLARLLDRGRVTKSLRSG
jgi:hypothetical protein